MTSTQYIEVGPITIRLDQEGTPVSLAGRYRVLDAPVVSPDAQIQVRLYEEFECGKTQEAEYPAFDCRRIDESTLAMSRLDAKGVVRVQAQGPVIANFEGLAQPHTLEAVIRLTASIALPRKDALILHSSAIENAGQAIVFSGISGAGKSTIAALLQDNFSVRRLSDELLLLVRKSGEWHLEVAPFTGKVDLPWGESSPLSSINLIEQSTNNGRKLLAPARAMAELPRHVVTYAHDPQILAQVLDLVGDLAETVPCYQLKFSKSPSVAVVLGLTCS